MHAQYNTAHAGAGSAQAVLLAEFFKWPFAVRKQFVQRQLADAPAFVREALLKAA